MKKKFIIAVVVVVIAICSFATYHFFFDTQRIEPQSLISQTYSPNGEYNISAYRNDGGATTDYAVLCVLYKNNDVNPIRNIYWNYPCDKAEIEWVDNDTVIINGVVIDNVFKDKYDWRYSWNY